MRIRRAIVIGAGGVAAIARLARRAQRARNRSASTEHQLTVRVTVAPELVDDLADLLRRVNGRATSDKPGEITVKVARGVSVSDVERELGTVLHRWSNLHPGVRVQVSANKVPRLPSRRRRREEIGAV